MVIGIPRGYFYYDYFGFIQRLFDGVSEEDGGIKLLLGEENNDEILSKGSSAAVDEACLPVKLAAGQAEDMAERCDMVFIPRIMKDCAGRWLCPKLLGIPELLSQIKSPDKLLITEPLNFKNKADTGRKLWKACRSMGMDSKRFRANFENAYSYQKGISDGKRRMHVEAAWEFTPSVEEGEIILPNIGKVFLAGHCYNVYDKFANGEVVKKLDELGLEAVTERAVSQHERELAVKRLGLIKKPFWESFIRTVGTAVCLKEKVEGIIYLSSFSCGPDAFIIEMIKKHTDGIPVMVLKLDEHKGQAGFETRLEAFADLLERRRAS